MRRVVLFKLLGGLICFIFSFDVYSQEIKTAGGTLLATYDVDKKEVRVVGTSTVEAYYTVDGEILSSEKKLWGYVKDGVVYFANNQIAGYFDEQSGAAYSEANKLLGFVKNDGTITDCDGNRLGTAIGVDSILANILVFHLPLFGKELGSAFSDCWHK